MTLRMVVVDREGEEQRLTADPGDLLIFGRTGGLSGVIGLSRSRSVSRAAFSVQEDAVGLCQVTCRQRLGAVEVKRPDGMVAAMLRRSESGTFHTPLSLVLHTADGAYSTVFVMADRAVPQDLRPGLSERDMSSTRAGWSTSTIMDPPPGLDWFVAAAMAAMLLRTGRTKDPTYWVQRGVLLRTCGVWLGAPKSEGWLASKFKQASANLAIPLETSPAQQLGEYVLQNSLLTDPSIRTLEVEYHRRRGG